MPHIEVHERTYRALELLALAWHTTIPDVVARLVITVAHRARPQRSRPATDPLAIHGGHAGDDIEATFDIASQAVTVSSGALRGRTYAAPSGARPRPGRGGAPNRLGGG